MKTEEFKVESFSPKKGDVLIVQSERRLSDDAAERIKSIILNHFGPDHKVLILDKGMSFKVVRENGDVDRWEDEGGQCRKECT